MLFHLIPNSRRSGSGPCARTESVSPILKQPALHNFMHQRPQAIVVLRNLPDDRLDLRLVGGRRRPWRTSPAFRQGAGDPVRVIPRARQYSWRALQDAKDLTAGSALG